MSTLHIARDVFAFLMVGLLLMFASEETKVIDSTPSASQACLFNPSKVNFKKQSRVTMLNQQPQKCFDVNFPIQIITPNGMQQTIDSNKALDRFILNWFEKNPNSNNEPTFSYPFGITLKDGQKILIKDEAQFIAIANACDEQILDENYASVNTFCFDFIYPIQLIAPNGQIQKANSSEQVDKAIQQWNRQHPNSIEELTIQFPIKIKFDDGIVISLEEVNALSAAIQYCESDSLEYDDEDDLENEKSDEVEIITPVIGA